MSDGIIFKEHENPGVDTIHDKQRYVCVDIETTGLSAARGGRIIEIGAVVIEGCRVINEYQTFVDPGARITLQAQRVHGITHDMLAGKPKPEDVFPAVSRLISSAAIVAHNAIFDVSFLRHEFGRLGLSLNNRYACTLRMSRRFFPNLCDHKLKTVYCHLFGALPEGSTLHRALGDARMAARVWMEIMKR